LVDRLLKLQNEQVKVIDAARMSVKRRKGVAFFVKHFPVRSRLLIRVGFGRI
jgi:hypothetical protein